MEFDTTLAAPARQRCGCTVAAIFEGRHLSAAARSIDEATGGRIRRLLRRSGVHGRSGDRLLILEPEGVAAERVLIVGAGKRGAMDAERFRRVARGALAEIRACGARDAVLNLAELEVDVEGTARDVYWKIRECLLAAEDLDYRFAELKTRPPERPSPPLRRIAFALGGRAESARAGEAIAHGRAIAGACRLARDLGNRPGNVCTPTHLAERARRIGRAHRAVHARVLDRAQMRRLHMGALLSVANGSREPPKLIALEYRGARAGARPVVLVGKGVTFDSGGISIKPAAAMDEMKFDMCGAASVLATVQAAAELRLKLNVVALVPATENLPGGSATKPGDIVRTMSGRTVEILNTDAEGRLILCDALTYAARYNPDVVIDVATLTGACVIALGNHATGLFTNHEPLARALLAAGEFAGDRAWQLPLWSDYERQLDSNFADVANVGGREGGAITAAAFLSKFTGDLHWAHMDIAGTAWRSGKEKGATGRPVPLLVQYLIDRAGRRGA